MFATGLWVGILATVIATILISVFWHFIIGNIGRFIIQKVIIHWSPGSRNISGTWDTKFWKGREEHNEIAKVSQLFGKVWGIIEFWKDGKLRKYRMTGSMKENVLSATYEIESPKESLDRGSFTLALSPDGTRLEGRYAWTDDTSQVPSGNKYVWTKPIHFGIDSIQIGKSPIHGKGVFASKQYKAGSDVTYFVGYEVDKDTRHSLTLENCKIEPTGPLKYLNHSCAPNCYFRGRTLVAKRLVQRKEELTIDYRETENHFTHPFKCKCKSNSCCKKVCTFIS